MFWDLLPTHGKPDEVTSADLDRTLLAVMEEILKLEHDACRESALHGLGHWHFNYPQQVEQIVARFLQDHGDIRAALLLYAEKARTGYVL